MCVCERETDQQTESNGGGRERRWKVKTNNQIEKEAQTEQASEREIR